MTARTRCVTCDAPVSNPYADLECTDCLAGIPVSDRPSSTIHAQWPEEWLTEQVERELKRTMEIEDERRRKAA